MNALCQMTGISRASYYRWRLPPPGFPVEMELRDAMQRRVIKPIARQLGVPWLSWHVFRHTHATLGEQIGMALSDRQAQMGHGDVRMTMHYTHSDLARRRAGVEEMSERLTASAAGTVN